jgi:TonB family protein
MYGSPKRSALLSGLLHAAGIVLILAATGVKNPPVNWLSTTLVTDRDIGRYLVSVPRKTEGGGGGGVRDRTPASRGRLPRAARRQFTPPVVIVRNLNPQLPMEPTLVISPEITLPTVNLAQFGDLHGVSGPPSGGRGWGGGIGDGHGTGVGDGDGPGLGPGQGGGVTGNAGFQGTATEPVLLWKIEPEYTEDARRAQLQGTVILHIEVDTRGQAGNITVRQGLGLGLDERAVEAVRRWKFRPGYRNGKPLVTAALVHVNFRLL